MFNYQPTGMGYNPNQQQQQPIYPQQTAFGQPNLYGSNIQPGYIQTQPTGFGGAPTVIENKELKIPSTRLSFITVQDQKKFEHLFRTAVPRGEQAITGDAASNILLRSGLNPVVLAEIWTLSDMDKTGALLFPEFALSLHLTNMAKRGEALPGVLPEKWSNEVRSFMDAINFSVPDDPNKILANTPFAKKDDWMTQPTGVGNWMQPQATGFQQNSWMQPQATGFGQQPQPQATGFGQLPQATGFGQQQPPQATGFGQQLAPQATGFGQPPPPTSFGQPGSFVPLQPQQTAGLIQKNTGLQPQVTGFLSQQRTGGLAPQVTGGLQQQRTGGLAPQTTGFQTGFNTIGLQPNKTGPLQANRTGPGFAPLQQQQQPTSGFLQQQQTGYLQQQPTGMLQQQPTGYLQAQPTGRPGEWGFVSMPTGGMPGLNTMQQVFQPNNTQNYQDLNKAMNSNSLSNVTWAISKQEKQIYDNLFQAWDTGRNGYVDSNVALNVFTKSGLSRQDLEAIWNLADTDDVGKLNKNQFAVAMHLIYRRLNGLDIPLRLPPELIPPADKTLRDTMDSLKNSLKNGGGKQSKSKPQTKPDGTRFKNDDNHTGYVSGSRYGRKSEAKPKSGTATDHDLSIDDLKKRIREKKILLDAMDVEDEEKRGFDSREVDQLKSKIYEIQTKITTTEDGSNQKQALLDRLNNGRSKISKLISSLNQVNNEISKRNIELVKITLKQENPLWDDSNVDLNASSDSSRFDLKQKMAMLTGKGSGSGLVDRKFREAVDKQKTELNNQTEMVRDIESGIKVLEDQCASKLNTSVRHAVGYEKWEKGFGVSGAVAEFVRELAKLQTPAVARKAPGANLVESKPVTGAAPPSSADTRATEKLATEKSAASSSSAVYTTPEERAAYIKAEAAKRMASRLEKLGISRSKRGGRPTEKTETEADKEVAKPSTSQAESPIKQEPQTSQPEIGIAKQPKGNSRWGGESIGNTPKHEDAPREEAKEVKAEAPVKQEPVSVPSVPETPKAEPVPPPPQVQETQSIKPASSYVPPVGKTVPEKVSEPAAVEPKVAAVAAPPVEAPKQAPASVPRHENNPFFKNKFQPVDPQKASIQRGFQRGTSNANSWSDSEDEDSEDDDDAPNRAGAAQLANLMFGGMPMQHTGGANISQAKPEPKTNHETLQKEEKPVEPAAEPKAVEPASILPPPPPPPAPDASAAPAVPSFEAPPPSPPVSVSQPPSLPEDVPPPPPPPSLPGSFPPAPPSLPESMPPPPPPPPAPPAGGFSAAPPPPPPPAPTAGGIPVPPSFDAGSSAPPQAPNIGALLTQITGGKSLKKVETKESSGATVGKVL